MIELLERTPELVAENWPVVGLVSMLTGMYYGYHRGYAAGYDDGFDDEIHRKARWNTSTEGSDE